MSDDGTIVIGSDNSADSDWGNEGGDVQALSSKREQATELELAGVKIAWGVLRILGIFILVSCCIFGIVEIVFAINYPALESGAIKNADMANDFIVILEHYSKQRDSFRDSLFKFIQLIAINVLLPVLTALLGYIFGTKSRQHSSRQSD
ncbi:hypothetical protein P886_1303 [Alteromonadaceae bacterium 2753L.S.0a.02]|nr:hypothetical protein P886_1303 [Alteromonadaceae bacterium 2753L.S.0a.02]